MLGAACLIFCAPRVCFCCPAAVACLRSPDEIAVRTKPVSAACTDTPAHALRCGRLQGASRSSLFASEQLVPPAPCPLQRSLPFLCRSGPWRNRTNEPQPALKIWGPASARARHSLRDMEHCQHRGVLRRYCLFIIRLDDNGEGALYIHVNFLLVCMTNLCERHARAWHLCAHTVLVCATALMVYCAGEVGNAVASGALLHV